MILCFDHDGEPKYGVYGSTVPSNVRMTEKETKVRSMRKENPRNDQFYQSQSLTDNLGVVHGSDRGDVHCTSDKHPHSDERKKLYRVPRGIEKKLNQHAVGCRTCESE